MTAIAAKSTAAIRNDLVDTHQHRHPLSDRESVLRTGCSGHRKVDGGADSVRRLLRQHVSCERKVRVHGAGDRGGEVVGV